MRTGKLTSISVALLAGLLLGATPALAQDEEAFPGTDPDRPFTGYTRSDGTIVLDDPSFCRFVLGTALGERPLTYVDLLDRSKKQKKARAAGFAADGDAGVIQRCVEALSAFREEPLAADALPGWARRSPVVPAALASLLPDDFVARPLAQPEQVGPAARTSGEGDQVSAPFAVAPGPWLAELDAVDCATWEGQLRDAQDPSRSFPLEGTREYLYELESGHYYWDVTASDCAWSVDLVPVVLGPDPTPTPEPRAVVPALLGPQWDRGIDAPNPDFLTAAQAREAVLAAGLVTGTCTLDDSANRSDRVWQQAPAAGSLVEYGTPVDVWIGRDCDVYTGDRVAGD